MKTGFKDPIAPKKEPKKVNNEKSWNFDQPQYDERSSCFVNAGSHYGIGHRQPVGTMNEKGSSPIPMGKVNTLKLNEYE